MIKKILPYLPVIIVAITLITGWTKVSGQTELNKTATEKISAKVDKLEDKQIELDKQAEVNENKTENLQKSVEEVKEDTKKIISLLMEKRGK